MADIINRTVQNEYYPCGALMAEKRLKNGKLDGVSKYYKRDGRLWAKQFWINGNEHKIEYCLPQHPPKQMFM
jgi:antitoxin component YwqK of YwqJK toxin-antitoxin module